MAYAGYSPPEPSPGEMLVPVSVAAGMVPNVSVSMLNRCIRAGIIPSYMPVGCQRERRVYVSQVAAAFGGAR